MSIAPPEFDFNGLLSPAFSKAIHGEDTQEIPNFSFPIDIFKVDVESFLDECEKLSKTKTTKDENKQTVSNVLDTVRTTRKPLSQLNSNNVESRFAGKAKKSFVELNQPPAINRNFTVFRHNVI